MVSCEEPSFTVKIVRLLHGDRNPAGPGFKQEAVGAAVDGEYEGRVQRAAIGSFALVEGLPALRAGFGFAAWIYPTAVEREEPQCLFALGQPGGAGAGAYIESGRMLLRLRSGDGAVHELGAEEELRPDRWHFVYAGLDATGAATLEWRALGWLPSAGVASASFPALAAVGLAGPLHLAAEGRDEAGVGAAYNGKIAAPHLFRRALDPGERERLFASGGDAGPELGEALVAAWNLGSDPALNSFRDRSGHGHHGVLFNRPTAAVTDHRWNGEAVDWKTRPGHYEAVCFHSDDLADAGWEADFSWEVPVSQRSGLYAAWLRAGEEEDFVPFVVRPPRTRATAEIGVLLPTFTYLAYANERQTEGGKTAEGDVYDEVVHDPRDALLAAHPEWGKSLYDKHPDGAGVCYSSARRPVTNLRPDYMMWAVGAPHGLGADLYLLDWLREKGFEHDVLSDHDLHYDGAALLRRYRVLITGSHPEYASAEMLAALREYLDGGGRLMYLGGNGFYWVTSVDPANPQIIEMRRGFNGTRVWESAPGEAYHSTSGEQGGLWRYRGKDPNRLVGIGFASQGFSSTSPGYERDPAASGPIAEMLFEGVEESPFGEYGLVLGGAAGAEIDRADRRHGTPDHTLVLASSTGHGDDYQLAIEDLLVTTPGLGGTEHADVRSDITFTETPNGGAVFAAGSIGWSGSLSHNGYDNGVSRLTENALRALLTVARWPRGDE